MTCCKGLQRWAMPAAMTATLLLLLVLAPAPAAAARGVGSALRFAAQGMMPDHQRSLLQTTLVPSNGVSTCDVSNVNQTGNGCTSGVGLIDAGAEGVLGKLYWKQVRQPPYESSPCLQVQHASARQAKVSPTLQLLADRTAALIYSCSDAAPYHSAAACTLL